MGSVFLDSFVRDFRLLRIGSLQGASKRVEHDSVGSRNEDDHHGSAKHDNVGSRNEDDYDDSERTKFSDCLQSPTSTSIHCCCFSSGLALSACMNCTNWTFIKVLFLGVLIVAQPGNWSRESERRNAALKSLQDSLIQVGRVRYFADVRC